MFHRTINTPKSRSFFLFGARATGKTTVICVRFPAHSTHSYNLLDLDVEEQLARDPMMLERQVLGLSSAITHVVLDEIQKLPKLLDVVHNLISTHRVPQSFILTGSSARKLKSGGANLLAGRAALRTLFPLTHHELGSAYLIEPAIRWGCLPAIWNASDAEERDDILRSYANVYVKEEIWAEQLVRRLDPFRRFLEVSARNSGKILNYSNIARDTGVDIKTVQAWYGLLEDTLIGFHVDAWHSSIRKQLRQSPKFYFFDTGVTRALSKMLNVIPHPQTGYYGDLFEQMVICELNARSHYENLDYKLNFILTKTNVEVDLIVERPGKHPALVEIKSTNQVNESHVSSLEHFAKDFPEAQLELWSQDPKVQKFGRITAMPWQQGIRSV